MHPTSFKRSVQITPLATARQVPASECPVIQKSDLVRRCVSQQNLLTIEWEHIETTALVRCVMLGGSDLQESRAGEKPNEDVSLTIILIPNHG